MMFLSMSIVQNYTFPATVLEGNCIVHISPKYKLNKETFLVVFEIETKVHFPNLICNIKSSKKYQLRGALY